jgi:hypothetical protein
LKAENYNLQQMLENQKEDYEQREEEDKNTIGQLDASLKKL